MKRPLFAALALTVLAGCSSALTPEQQCIAEVQDRANDQQKLKVISFEPLYKKQTYQVYRLNYYFKNRFGRSTDQETYVCRLYWDWRSLPSFKMLGSAMTRY